MIPPSTYIEQEVAFCEGILIGTILSLFVWFWVVHG